MISRKDIEIMAPVGSYESLNAAIAAGADSVYFGVEQLNMRAASSVNFTLDDLAEIVRIAHAAGVKTYLTVNIVIYDDEMEVMRRIIDRAKAEGIDAIIATDLAAILYAREVGIEVHISTQSNISNITAVKFFAQWADVVVLARELSLEQIAEISKQIKEQNICGPAGELVRLRCLPMARCVCRCRVRVTSRSMSRTTRLTVALAVRYVAESTQLRIRIRVSSSILMDSMSSRQRICVPSTSSTPSSMLAFAS